MKRLPAHGPRATAGEDVRVPKIGPKLREMRRRRNLSARELAARSGVSHSSISLIERDRISPSVDTLAAILDALGATVTGFFLDLQNDIPYQPFYGSEDFVEIYRGESLSYRMLGAHHPNRQLLVLHETFSPGGDSGDAYFHSAQEAGMVLKGAVEVTVGTEKRILRQGDGYYFDSRLPHRFRNVFNGESEILSASTPPTY